MKKSILTICSVAMVSIMALTLTSCESVEPSQVVGSWAFSSVKFTATGATTSTTMTKKDIEDWQPSTPSDIATKIQLLEITKMNFTLKDTKTFGGYLPIAAGGFTMVDGTWSTSGTTVVLKDEFHGTKWEPKYNKSDNTMVMTGETSSGTADYVFTK